MMWSKTIKNYVICMSAIVLWCLPSFGLPSPRPQLLNHLKEVTSAIHSRLEQVDARLQSVMEKSANLKVTQPSWGQKLTSMEKEMETLIELRKELVARQDFLNRLTFQVDTHYRGGPIKAFLHSALQKMAKIEATSSDPSTSMWKFLNYLSVAVRDLPERNEDILDFIEGYIAYSGVLKPVRPDTYLNQRHYTNGSESASAKDVHQTEVGLLVEKSIKTADAGSFSRLPKRLPAPELRPVRLARKDLIPASSQPVSTSEAKNHRLPEKGQTSLPTNNYSSDDMKVRLLKKAK